MKQSLFALAVSGLFAESTPDDGTTHRTASVASLTKDKPLSGVILKSFFEGSDAKKVAEKVAAAEGTRLQYLMRTFPNSSTDDVKNAVKEYRDMAKSQSGEKSPEANSARVRGQEVQALYGAWRFAKFQPDGMSYHSAVAGAREALKPLNIRWDGARIPEKWEREVRQTVERDAQAQLAAKMEIERAHRSGKELSDDEIEAIESKAKQEQARADMVKLARGLHKKYGSGKCQQLVEALEGVIAAEDQAAKDNAKAKQQQAA